ncbi:membrane-associating domain-domain-containing protein [Coniella lustricola]|uniref:Membrane-associating domain-domain-containing protein n=1 Tax=Coniella lustricola TaxID=2025994 RepID=A0A2T2ZXW3_9PEZI|nr:membrane-associating domain-domain-containing protein [Coniella lustricola]
MAFPLILALRAVQALFAIIILGLTAYVANWYDVQTLTSSPSQINFMVFVPLFTLISVAYLEAIPRFMPKFHHPWAVIALELTNVLFYFAGFIALAVFLSKLLFCRGTVCSSARAATAFGSFEWALWAVTAGLTLKDALKGGFAGLRNAGSGGRSGGNSQAQFDQRGPPMKEAAMAA